MDTRKMATRVVGLFVLIGALFASVATGGTLNGALAAGAVANQDLTTEGTEDWAIWGFSAGGTSTSLTPDVRRLGGASISDLTDLSNGTVLRGLGQFGAFAHTFDWTDGTPTAMATGATGGIQHDTVSPPGPNPVGEGFSFTVPADLGTRMVRVYIATHVGTGQLTASLSDGSAPNFVQTQGDDTTANLPGVYTLEYAADSNGQTLTVEFVLTNQAEVGSNVQVHAVSLTEPAPLPPVAVPTAGNIGLLTLLLLITGFAVTTLRRQG